MSGEDPGGEAVEGEEMKQGEAKEPTVVLPVVFNLQRPGTLLMLLQVGILCTCHVVSYFFAHT
jgi:hypothetical protein